VEEPSGTGFRGSSRDSTSAGAAVAFDRRREPHLTNHIDAAISRFLDARFDGEARQSLTEWVELRPSRDDRSRGHLLERSERLSALRLSWAVA
jgi:hypothetical protein